jgi:hypothetical protein
VEPFAFAALGLLLGVVLCLIAACAYHLYASARKMQAETELSTKLSNELIRSNTSAISRLDDRVSSALTKLDAAQLHEASLSIQRSALRLARAVGMLHKLAYAQDGATALAAEDAEDFDRETLPADPTPVDALNYQQWLHQGVAERQRVESVVRPPRPLPDIQEGFDQDEAENLAAFRPEGGF